MARLDLLTISVIACISASLQQAMALRCWECNSNNKDACKNGKKLPEEMLIECDPSYTSPICLKLESTAFGYVQRICAQNNATAITACDEARIHDKEAFCGICYTHGCNSAPTHYGSSVLWIAIPIAIMKLLSLQM